MAQNTFADGDVLTASEINTYLMGEGGAWTSWTPTVTQSGSVAVTVNRATYARYGRTIHAQLSVSVTGSGTGANAVVVSIPATAAASGFVIGTASLFDSSANLLYRAHATLSSTAGISLSPTNSSSVSNLGVADFTAGLASGDSITATFTYEAAS